MVTGSQDERAFVWDSKSDTQLAMIEGHNDTIVSVAFHPQEPYLATADMLGEKSLFICLKKIGLRTMIEIESILELGH